MAAVDQDALRVIAAECVNLVSTEFGRQLDWSLESLTELDMACASLMSDGPLSGERLDLWWKITGAYTGEVLTRIYGGMWVEHESSPDAPGVSVLGVTAFPFSTAHRILTGEPFKSFASVGRSIQAVAAKGD